MEISRCLREAGIADAGALEKFERYAALLLETNKQINLTAITDPKEIAWKHFYDSIKVLEYAKIPPGAALIDVGTGAGFPGVPIKIMRPDLQLTLLDSLRKRTNFLTALSEAMEQENRIVHARAEDYGKDKAAREQFDAASSRAVAPLRMLCEYCLPFVKRGGLFLALKGGDVAEELAQAKNAIAVLGGECIGVESYALPNLDRRSLVIIEKISQTPPNYPRIPAKITKAPL
jgi:16S rRNA (guanine(527)-N(7))-methyltransferase GidB